MREAFREALGRALAETERRHLLSRQDFETHLQGRSTALPECFEGVEPCISAQTLVFDQLGLTALVRIRARSSGDRLEVTYRLVDRRDEVTKQATLEATDPEELAYRLVRELFDATGTVAIRSTPPGAAVRVDGESIGTAPIEARLPIGDHTYQLRHPDRRDVEGEFHLSTGESKTLEETLPQKPGRLVVQNAPEGAAVHVDGTERGAAGEPIELEPGAYEIAVRASGFEPHEERVEIDSGETLRRNIPLQSSSRLLQDIPADEIAVNRYIARLSYDHAIHPTSFRDARGHAAGREFEFEGFASNSGALPGDRVVKRTVAPFGVRADFGYTGRHFGVVLASLSYTAAQTDRSAYVEVSGEERQRLVGTVTSLRRLQLRPLQVSYRYFYKNFVPKLELGTGMTFQWLTMEELPENSHVTLGQTEAFWNVGLTGQYFFDANWFGLLRYSLQDYFNAGKGVEHILSLGIGVAYPNLLGFEPEPPEQL